jgi:hypothetical protein
MEGSTGSAGNIAAPVAVEFHVIVPLPPGCIFAANGVGCILAEIGCLKEAKEIFLQVSGQAWVQLPSSVGCSS